MRFYKAKIILLTSVLVVGFLGTPARADSLQLEVAEDRTTGYNRTLFKHWIDADKDGCDTRAEVLLEEAVTKPKVGAKCKLSGGKWLSSYDGKTITNASQLDVDHLVPLAEAWRSGAWKWTPAQRQAYANDLEDSRALIAVTLSSNRSKGDKDPSKWMPANGQCNYAENWVAIKTKYALTFDEIEASKLVRIIEGCGLNATAINQLSIPDAPTPSPTPVSIVTPGAFCSPAGAIGKSTSGVTYTCNTSPTDSRNRWRQ